jgi:hypothetical protein
MQGRHLGSVQVPGTPPRVESRLPQDLVAQQVAQTADDGLVHEDTLQPTPTASEYPLQAGRPQAQRVRALPAHDLLRVLAVAGEPDSLELALVAVLELATVGGDSEAIVRVRLVLRRPPHELAGHPEVQEQLGFA